MPEEPANTSVASPSANTSLLNQNVPNPLAKNPNFFTHKVFAAIGLVLVGVVLVLFGLALIYHVNLADLFSTTPASDNTKISTPSAKPATATTSAKSTSKFTSAQIVKALPFKNSKGETKELLIVSMNGNTDAGYLTDSDFSIDSAIKVKEPFTGCSAVNVEALRGCLGDSSSNVSPGPGVIYLLISRANADAQSFDVIEETGVDNTIQINFEALKLQDKCMCAVSFSSWKDASELYLVVRTQDGNYRVLIDAKTGKVEGSATKV